jgi:hypothetical protein
MMNNALQSRSRRGRRSIYLGSALIIVIAVWCTLVAMKVRQANKQKEAIASLEDLGGAISYANGSNDLPAVSFRNGTIGDGSLATIAVRLRILGPIETLDLRGTRITGKTLVALRGMEVNQLILDPTQVDRFSIQQLDHSSVGGIRLTGGVSEKTVMELVPALAAWKGKLFLDTISSEGLRRLQTEAPNLAGVQADDYWHPIAQRWR